MRVHERCQPVTSLSPQGIAGSTFGFIQGRLRPPDFLAFKPRPRADGPREIYSSDYFEDSSWHYSVKSTPS